MPSQVILTLDVCILYIHLTAKICVVVIVQLTFCIQNVSDISKENATFVHNDKLFMNSRTDDTCARGWKLTVCQWLGTEVTTDVFGHVVSATCSISLTHSLSPRTNADKDISRFQQQERNNLCQISLHSFTVRTLWPSRSKPIFKTQKSHSLLPIALVLSRVVQ